MSDRMGSLFSTLFPELLAVFPEGEVLLKNRGAFSGFLFKESTKRLHVRKSKFIPQPQKPIYRYTPKASSLQGILRSLIYCKGDLLPICLKRLESVLGDL